MTWVRGVGTLFVTMRAAVPVLLATLPAIVLACGGGLSTQAVDGGSPDARTSTDAGLDVGITCTAPMVKGGSSGGVEVSTNYGETCGNDASYWVLTTCPYGEVECPSEQTVPYDCDSGASGAFAACGLPHR